MQKEELILEVEKKNKISNELEWTQTLQLDYNIIDEKQKEEKLVESLAIEEELLQAQANNETPAIEKSNNQFDLHKNPFYQPENNTIEFSLKESTITVSISKESAKPITLEDKLAALEKLFFENIIDENEFLIQKEILIKSK